MTRRDRTRDANESVIATTAAGKGGQVVSDKKSDGGDHESPASKIEPEQLMELLRTDSAFHTVVEMLPMHFIQKDMQGRILFANQRYCDLAQKSLEELIGKSSFDMFPAAKARKYNEGDRKAMEAGEVVRVMEEHTRSDGTVIHVEVFKGPMRDPDGKVTGLLVLFWDVSKREQFQQAYDQERHLLGTLLENIPDFIYFKDKESRFLRTSKSLSDKFGQNDPSDLVGTCDADYFQDDEALAKLEDERSLVEGTVEVVQKEECEQWADGRNTWVLTTKLPLRDKHGETIGTFGISRNITDRKLAEADLANERDRLRTIINNVPDVIFVKDRAGRFITGNEAFLKSVGQESIEELVGKTDFDFWPAELACNFVADDQIVMRSGKALANQEESGQDAQGNAVWQLTSKVPLFDNNGVVTGLVGVGRDITASRRVKVQLSLAKEEADAASRAKSDFLANMSHEIRTPLNAIIGMTELMMEGKQNTGQHEYLKMIQDSGDALLTVINDILDFSKIEAGRLELDPVPFDLRETIGNTMKSLAMRAHAKSIELAFRVQKEVPRALNGDVGRFRQIVVNLVGNAIKFTQEGEVVVDVGVVRTTPAQTTLLVKVRDTGIGIAPEAREKIFDEFQQADTSTTRRFGGTGLGLAISSRLVGLMGGRISVTSQPGRGSEFQFTVKFDSCQASELPSPPKSPVIVGGTRVLIVDDNSTNRLILMEMLNNWGMIPTEADSVANARTCLEESLLTDERFQIILSDVHMPDVDGYSFVEEVRNNPEFADIPVMMLTSGMRTRDKELNQRLNIAACMMKPVKQSELFDAIVRTLGVNSPEDSWQQRKQTGAKCRPLKILLAEDNIVNQKLALGVLERDSHEVTIVDNGKDAVSLSDTGKFDLILMDVQMPIMDGLDATQAIRRREEKLAKSGTVVHMPIVAMTANAMKGDREHCLGAGMDDYLSKPIRIQELTDKLSQFASLIDKTAGHTAGTKTDSASESAKSAKSAKSESTSATSESTSKSSASKSAAFEPGFSKKLGGESIENSGDVTDGKETAQGESKSKKTADAGHVNWNKALENVGNSPELLVEVVDLFLKDSPDMLKRCHEAVGLRNPKQLKAAAHSLKGAMLFLHTREPFQSAFSLERMGHDEDLTHAESPMKILESQMTELYAELNEFIEQKSSSK